MSDTEYPYSLGDGLTNPQTYQFSSFEGRSFLDGYFLSRKGFTKGASFDEKELQQTIQKIKKSSESSESDSSGTDSRIHTIAEISRLLATYDPIEGVFGSGSIYAVLSALIRRFEVTKRLYGSYDRKYRDPDDGYESMKPYLLLSFASLLFYGKSANLKFLNAALKINDLICSRSSHLDDGESRKLFQLIVGIEMQEIRRLMGRLEIR